MQASLLKVDGISIGDEASVLDETPGWYQKGDTFFLPAEEDTGESRFLGSFAHLKESKVQSVAGRQLTYLGAEMFTVGDRWELAFEKLEKSAPDDLIRSDAVSAFYDEAIGLRVLFIGPIIHLIEIGAKFEEGWA